MKSLEQLLIQARSAVRAAQARVPGLSPRPTRLVLRLNDLHLGPNLLRATGAPLKEKEWRDTIVRFERWLGPLRLTIAGGEPAQSGLLPALVRFGNRLECPTHVVTGGPITTEQAEAMVDWGLSAVTVLVGGIDEGSHRAAVGTRLDEAVATVEAFREARAKRKRPLGLYVCVPLTDANTGGAGAVAGWARQAGADGVLATVPLGAEPPRGGLEAVEALGRDNLTPDHLRRWLGGERARVGGGFRAELLSDGTLIVSSCARPLGNVRDAEPEALWTAGAATLKELRDHPRPWDEVELVPERLRSRR